MAPLPAFIADTRYGWRGYNLARWASPLRRRMDYLTTLVTTDTYAKEVKLFGLGDVLHRAVRAARRGSTRRACGGSSSPATSSGSCGRTITTLAGSLTYLYVALEAIAGRLTIGDLTLFTQAAASVQGSVQGLLGGFGSMYEHNLYLNDLVRVPGHAPPGIDAPREPDGARSRGPARGEVVVRRRLVPLSRVGGRAALDEVSLRIEPGETVAVVGRNGAGKSTLIKLLCRLYDPIGRPDPPRRHRPARPGPGRGALR